MTMYRALERSEQLAVGPLFGLGLVLGLAGAASVGACVEADPQAVWQASEATALFIAGFGAAGDRRPARRLSRQDTLLCRSRLNTKR